MKNLNAKLQESGIPLTVASGAEVALSKVADLDDRALAKLCLGHGRYLLVESPCQDPRADVEGSVLELIQRGFRPTLAHPERCPAFQRDPERLNRMVERGVLCSVTGGSMSGRFGETVRRFTTRLFRLGLVHDVASDAHDHVHRPPDLHCGLRALERTLPGLAAGGAGSPKPSRPRYWPASRYLRSLVRPREPRRAGVASSPPDTSGRAPSSAGSRPSPRIGCARSSGPSRGPFFTEARD